MHKIGLITGLALALAGCAAQQGQAPQVQVRDLSASREATSAGTYRVEPGDTLYGIAWRHDMDYRDLARLNRISPPYDIQPGQQLALSADASPSAREADEQRADEPARERDDSGAVATGLGGGRAAEAEASGELDWLLPDETAIERNRRLTAERREAGEDLDGPSRTAMQSADEVAEADQGPGPVYDYESPGADGALSERDLAERRELEVQQAEAEREASSAPDAEEPAESRGAQEPEEAMADSEEEADATPEQVAETEPASEIGPDAGTSVAGAPEAGQRSERRYTPVAEVPWQWPVEGEVVGGFGEGSSITAGIDIAGQKGQPVRAAGPGIVVYAGSGVRGYGNLVLLKHNDQFLSAYAHNDDLRVRENDVVEAGEVIATMGDSDAEDVRLHFEVRKDGQPQDPLEFLPTR